MPTQAGYMLYAATTCKYSFDLQPEEDVYWCTADIGWITGHTYVTYGPMLNGCTSGTGFLNILRLFHTKFQPNEWISWWSHL